MPVNETLASQWLELITDPSWWFNRMVELYASAYWYTGDGDGFLALIEKVCIDCDMAPLGRHGYTEFGEPIRPPGGAEMVPMWRPAATASRRGTRAFEPRPDQDDR